MRVVIIGAGHWSAEVREVLEAGGHEVIGWLDDRTDRVGTEHLGRPVLGTVDYLRSAARRDFAIHVAIGHPGPRRRCYELAKDLGYELANAIHPRSVVMPSARVGRGVFVGPCAVIGSGATVGDGVIVQMGSTIGHDSRLEDGVFLGPGVHTGGGVSLGRDSFCGPGVTLVAGASLGAGSVVAAGIMVACHVPSHVYVFTHGGRGFSPIDDSFDWSGMVSGVPPNHRDQLAADTHRTS